MPSLPTIAISIELPFSITCNSETTAPHGKYTQGCARPSSYNTSPDFSMKQAMSGTMRARSSLASAASNSFGLKNAVCGDVAGIMGRLAK